MGKEWTLRLPWPNSGTSSRSEVHRFTTFIQPTLNIHSEPGNVRDAKISSKEQGKCNGGWLGPGWSMAWGLSVHSLCLECRGKVGRIVVPRWNGGWPRLVGEVRHEMPS